MLVSGVAVHGTPVVQETSTDLCSMFRWTGDPVRRARCWEGWCVRATAWQAVERGGVLELQLDRLACGCLAYYRIPVWKCFRWLLDSFSNHKENPHPREKCCEAVFPERLSGVLAKKKPQVLGSINKQNSILKEKVLVPLLSSLLPVTFSRGYDRSAKK